MIGPDLEAEILRLHAAEKWPVGTIAYQLHVHHDVVRRVLLQAGTPRAKIARPSMIDAYLPFVLEQWEKFPKLPASRLYRMCRERGYPGGPDRFRQAVASYRPKPRGEAFLRVRTLPAEEAQADWAHFGKVRIGKAERQLVAFVMVLSYSRSIFCRYYLGLQTENFLRGHEAAFAFWGGVPRRVLYDNLKSAVLERRGEAIRYNPRLLDFAAHHRFEPRAVGVRRGNEKGRVERAIRYLRSDFFIARSWSDLADLNAKVLRWCDTCALDRRWPEDRTRADRDALEEERPRLLPLPEAPFPTDERKEIAVRKTPYIRFDRNDYSVPHELCRRTVVVVASEDVVRVLHGAEEVCRHRRSYDKGQVVEDPAHVEGLVQEKRAARRGRGIDRLSRAVPTSPALFKSFAERGKNLGNATSRLLYYLDTYGAESLEAALQEVLASNAIHLSAIRRVLERDRAARGRLPASPIPLPDDPRIRDLSVRPHNLDAYEALGLGLRASADGSDAERDLDPKPNPPPAKETPHDND